MLFIDERSTSGQSLISLSNGLGLKVAGLHSTDSSILAASLWPLDGQLPVGALLDSLLIRTGVFVAVDFGWKRSVGYDFVSKLKPL